MERGETGHREISLETTAVVHWTSNDGLDKAVLFAFYDSSESQNFPAGKETEENDIEEVKSMRFYSEFIVGKE